MTTEQNEKSIKPVFRDISRQRIIFSDGSELTYEEVRRLTKEGLRLLGFPQDIVEKGK